jgi:hypothetical protein
MKKDKYDLCFNSNYWDYTNKEKASDLYINTFLNKCLSMFEYRNIPEGLNVRSMELYMFITGHVTIIKHDNNIYAVNGSLGGVPDEYYMPSISIVSNPYLKIFNDYKINSDCVVIPNDKMYYGLLPIFQKYASALTENEISLNIASVNSRIISLISAPDDRTYKSAEKYLQDIADGKNGIIAENSFLDGIKSQPYGSMSQSNTVTNLIEYEQYLKASLYHEIGLNANYNMKRESLNSGETELNNDILMPLIDNMLSCRKNGIEKVNNMFGANMSVSLSSTWLKRRENIEHEID